MRGCVRRPVWPIAVRVDYSEKPKPRVGCAWRTPALAGHGWQSAAPGAHAGGCTHSPGV